MTVSPRKPSGFGEYLPHEQLEFNRLLAIIRDAYERHGFTPLDTPDIELAEVLLAKGGGETDRQVYKFQRSEGSDELCLRFDLTVPLARYVAEHEHELTFPFRRYQIGKVHRAERAQRGRFREFYQCDIDVIGSDSTLADAEFPVIINEIFDSFGFGEFTIRLNNRMILNGFFEGLGLSDVSASVLRVVDKMEKVEPDEFRNLLAEVGLDDSQVDAVLQFLSIDGTDAEMITQLRALGIQSTQFDKGVTQLEGLVQALEMMSVPSSRYKIDLKIARGLDYYTGTVYETILDEYPGIGSVCSGGRYDDLASHYTDTSLPGVGISIGLSRLFYQLREIGVIQATAMTPADICVMPMDVNDTAMIQAALKVASMIRESGRAVMLYSEPDKMKKKLRYANAQGFSWVVIIGESEAHEGTVTLKDMSNGTQETISQDTITQHLKG